MDSPTQPSPPLLDPHHSPHSAIPPHVFVASPLPACCFDFSEEKREVNFAVALVALSRNVQRSDRGTVAATASHCIFEWMEQRVEFGRGDPPVVAAGQAAHFYNHNCCRSRTRSRCCRYRSLLDPPSPSRLTSAPSRRVIIRCARRQTKREEEERRNE